MLNNTKFLFLPPLLALLVSCSSTRSVEKSVPIESAAIPPGASSLSGQIDQLLNDSLFASCFTGMKIVSLEEGHVLYERNAARLFHPASNLKLITTSAAMALLDDGYTFRTPVFLDSVSTDDVSAGSLYVKGQGDPLLTTADLDSLASVIRGYGIRTISGDLVGDVSYFDDLPWGHGWMWDDEPEADEAFISPLTVNGNSIKVTVTAGIRLGSVASAVLEPVTSYLTIANRAVSSDDTLLQPLVVTRRRGENSLTVDGRISPSLGPKEFTLSVWKPEMYFLHLLRERLFLHGVLLRGTLRIDTVHGNEKIAEITHPFDSVLHEINKLSSNVAAENLLKTISARMRGTPGTSAEGLTLVRNYLVGIGIDTAAMLLADGSGVSWYNAVSPAALTRLLEVQYQHKETFQRFYESLPIAGTDGTLKGRMKGTLAEGNVHAKTGSLTGVSAISGYVTTADGKPLAFSFLCDHFPQKISLVRSVQDRILELLANHRSIER